MNTLKDTANPEPRLPVALRYGPVIAEFTRPADAKLFARLKLEAGEDVTIVPAINADYLVAVRTLVRSL